MRRLVTDGDEVYRVVVVRRKKIVHPEYVQGGPAPYWKLLDETYNAEYGPYNRLPTAKGVLTREAIDTDGDGSFRWGVVAAWIEKASTVWQKVEL
jgi:hypothetical protein